MKLVYFGIVALLALARQINADCEDLTPDYDLELCGDEKPLKSCPEGWLDSPDGCFYFVTDVWAMTWEEAVRYCHELGGYLAEVLNDETQRFLVEQATALGTSTNWWLGATDYRSEGIWVWTKTGKLVDLESQSWYGHQPSNGIPLGPSSDSYQNQDCLHLYAPWGYQWDDLNCVKMAWGGNPNKPICQKRLTTTTTTPRPTTTIRTTPRTTTRRPTTTRRTTTTRPTTTTRTSTTRRTTTTTRPSCPEGWLDSPDGCFYFATDVEAKTWNEAVGYCRELGGYLAEVLNGEIQRLLVEQATALGTSTNWWLGATDQDLEGTWIWTRTGRLVDLDTQAWAYDDQPDNGGRFDPSDPSYHNEDCLHLVPEWGYDWNDSNCDSKVATWNEKQNKPICQKIL